MSFLSHRFQVARSPFTSGVSHKTLPLFSTDAHWVLGLGSVRTAMKRAGGTVHNHGGSPGKRLGVKKFSGSSNS